MRLSLTLLSFGFLLSVPVLAAEEWIPGAELNDSPVLTTETGFGTGKIFQATVSNLTQVLSTDNLHGATNFTLPKPSDIKHQIEDNASRKDGLNIAKSSKKETKHRKWNSSAKSQKSNKSAKSETAKSKSSKSKSSKYKKETKKRNVNRTNTPTYRPTEVTTGSFASISPTYFPTSNNEDEEDEIIHASSHMILEVDPDRVIEPNKDALMTITLRFLNENIGGDSKFDTKYVNITMTDSLSESIAGKEVDTTVFSLDVTFAMTKSFARWVEEEWDEVERDYKRESGYEGVASFVNRRYSDNKSVREDKKVRYANMCLSSAINRNQKKGTRCNRKRKNVSAWFDAINDENDNFYNRRFVDVVNESTDLQTRSVHSVLGAPDAQEILLCGLAHVALLIFYDANEEEYDDIIQPYLPFFCRKYEEFSCTKYEDYLCDDYEKANCRGPCDDVEVPPTISPWPTATPTTLAPTTHYTPRPTWETPETIAEGFSWGASEALGKDDMIIENTRPIKTENNISVVAAGPGYSILLHDDGTVQVSGFIDSIENYHGHLGLPLESVNQGSNPLRKIEIVYDTTGSEIIDSPRFKTIYAGADQLSPGAMHSLFIDENGRVWTMGSNSKGQLCLGDFEDRMIPTKVPMAGRIVSAAIGGQHTLLLHEQGVVFSCGSNEEGQIGQSMSAKNSSVPSTIYGPYPAETVSAGLSHSLILTEKKIYVMGNNSYGQLCVSSDGQHIFNPVELTMLFGRREILAFEAIQSSSYILYIDGSISGCGRNDFGQLGDGTNDSTFMTTPRTMAYIRKLGIGPSSQSAFFIGYNNNAYATGLNNRGQLGLGHTYNMNTMAKVSFPGNIYVKHLSAASDHSLSAAFSLTIPKRLFHWGDSASFGFRQDVADKTKPAGTNNTVTDVSAGSLYSIILHDNGTAQSAGFIEFIDEYHGHLGLPSDIVNEGTNPFRSISQVYDPVKGMIVDAPKFMKVYAGVDDLSPGAMHTLFIDDVGQVWATGSNSKGQLCLGDYDDRVIPSKISTLIPGRITSAAIGGQHTLLLHESGVVLVCGSNERGQIGLGKNITRSNTPILSETFDGDRWTTLVDVETIFSGLEYSLVMSSYYGFAVTGSNLYGQFCADNGGETSKSSSYILLNNGNVYACGRNNAGQLGDGTIEDKFMTITSLPLLMRDIGVGPGSESVYFIGEDGHAYSAGLNDKGQLGLGDTMNRAVPAMVDFGANVVTEQISASGGHVLSRAGLRKDTAAKYALAGSMEYPFIAEYEFLPGILEESFVPQRSAGGDKPTSKRKKSFAVRALEFGAKHVTSNV